jgi:hypothetical protein
MAQILSWIPALIWKYIKLHEAELLIVIQPVNCPPPPILEPKASLPRSQEPTSGPYPKPDESSSHYHTLFL